MYNNLGQAYTWTYWRELLWDSGYRRPVKMVTAKAIVDYHLSFFWPRKTSFCFPFPFIAYKQKFALSVYKKKGSFRFPLVPFSESTYMYIEMADYIRKPRRSMIRLPFAHCANGSLSFVSLLTKKQIELILMQTNQMDKTDLPIYSYVYIVKYNYVANNNWLPCLKEKLLAELYPKRKSIIILYENFCI